MSATSFLDPGTSATSRIVPRRISSSSSVARATVGFTGEGENSDMVGSVWLGSYREYAKYAPPASPDARSRAGKLLKRADLGRV